MLYEPFGMNAGITMLADAAPLVWHTPLMIAAGLLAASCLAMQQAMSRSSWLAVIGIAALGGAGWISCKTLEWTPEQILLTAFAVIAVFASICFVSFRHPIHSALSFAVTVLSSCGILMMHGAEFLGAATIVVYAGATIIVFLFVLMLSASGSTASSDQPSRAPLLSIVFAVVFIGLLMQVIHNSPFAKSEATSTRPLSAVTSDSNDGQVAKLGRSLFTDYLWTIELAGTLLTAAAVGAIALTHHTEGRASE